MIKKILRNIFSSRINSREVLLNLLPKDSICAEIGVWKGQFSKEIIDRVLPRKLHLIDPWKYQTEFGKRLYGGMVAQNQQDMDRIYEQVVEDLSLYKNVQIHREFSNSAHFYFENGYFDWVYIDGNHYYDYVLEDLENYAPKLKSNGLLTGDDFQWTSPELKGDKPIKRAVEDFIKKRNDFKFYKVIGSQFMLKKMYDNR